MTSTRPHPIVVNLRPSIALMARTSASAKALLSRSAIYPLAGTYLPDRLLGPNWINIGQAGCGKTLEERQLMWRVLQPLEYEGTRLLRHRALVLDQKGSDILPDLLAWVPREQLGIVNPFHPHGVRWAIGRDCRSAEAGTQLGHGIIPETEKSHEFFSPAARQLLHGVIHTFQKCGQDWFLSDVTIACSSEQNLRMVLAHHPRGQEILATYLPPGIDTSKNLVTSLAVKLEPWSNAALLERTATHHITIRSWMESSGVLVLLGDALNPDVVDRYNSLFFKYVVRHIKARSDDLPVDESFLFLDEMPKHILDDYRDAMLLGRSKGIRTVATVQDPSTLISRLGSREEANEILGQIGNLWTGRLTGPDAAEWLSRFYGKFEYWEEKPGWSSDSKGRWSSRSGSSDIRETYNIYPYEFQGFPRASLEHGYTAVARTPGIVGWRAHVSPGFIQQNLGPRDESRSDQARRQITHEDLTYQWTAADLARLGLRRPAPKQFKLPKKSKRALQLP